VDGDSVTETRVAEPSASASRSNVTVLNASPAASQSKDDAVGSLDGCHVQMHLRTHMVELPCHLCALNQIPRRSIGEERRDRSGTPPCAAVLSRAACALVLTLRMSYEVWISLEATRPVGNPDVEPDSWTRIGSIDTSVPSDIAKAVGKRTAAGVRGYAWVTCLCRGSPRWSGSIRG